MELKTVLNYNRFFNPKYAASHLGEKDNSIRTTRTLWCDGQRRVWPQEGLLEPSSYIGPLPEGPLLLKSHFPPFGGHVCRTQHLSPEVRPQSHPHPRRPYHDEQGGPRQKLRTPNTYYFAGGPRGLHADAKLAVQVDDGVVDEGEDFQLKLGLVGVPVLNHAGVSVGDGAAGRRAEVAH